MALLASWRLNPLIQEQTQLLYPLSEFYKAAGKAAPDAVELRGEDVPEPYRRLLVHRNDMTPTLEAFHGERIHLRVVGRRLDGEDLSRQVVLTTNDSQRPVEFGAIVIHCANYPAAARAEILESRTPLGTILAKYGIQHVSCPQAFFRLTSDSAINEALGLEGPATLYGRRNVHTTLGGAVLAEVLEILPPSA